MTAQRRGRPKGTVKGLTAGGIADLERIGEAWKRHYQAQLDSRVSPRTARSRATKAVAEEIDRTPTWVRTLLKRYYREVEPVSQSIVLAMRQFAPQLEKLTAAKALVTSEEAACVLDEMPVRAAVRLAELLIRGAAAETENRRLRAENEKLKAQLMVWKGSALSVVKAKSPP